MRKPCRYTVLNWFQKHVRDAKDSLRSGYNIGEFHKFNLEISYNSRKFQVFNLYAMQCLHLPSLTLHSIHAVTEVISLGLQTTVHPAINAGPILKLIKVMVSIREVVLLLNHSITWTPQPKLDHFCQKTKKSAKGKLISKGLFYVIVWTKKPTIFLP